MVLLPGRPGKKVRLSDRLRETLASHQLFCLCANLCGEIDGDGVSRSRHARRGCLVAVDELAEVARHAVVASIRLKDL
jgi:hypothetical protein